jgi:hypothetical protein
LVARFLRIRTAFLAVLLLGWTSPCWAKPDAAELQSRYQALNRQYAGAVPGWRPRQPASGSLLFVAPDEYSGSYAVDQSSRAEREKRADALFELAKQAADAGQLSLAFQWTTEAVRENPDQAKARRVLGYEQRDGKWLTAYGVKMFDAHKVWDHKHGWITNGEAAAAEAKEEADAARHAEIKTGWQIRTDHFQVTTNDSMASGAELASRLEQLYQIWRQLFAGFFYSEQEVRGLFSGERSARKLAHPFHVIYYRNKQEYVDALRKHQPRIGETLGVYFDMLHEAHFFAGDEHSASTLFHEAVHQLFQESKPTAKHIGATANFWVVEGVATYFETLAPHVDPRAGLFYTIGDLNAGRLPMERQRVMSGAHMPIRMLTRMDKGQFQAYPQIIPLYSESAGLAAFLIDSEHARYREPFVRYLQAVYAGHDNEGTLADLTETSFTELDAQYRRYLESLP